MLSPTDVRAGNWVLKIMGVDRKKEAFLEYKAIALNEYYFTFAAVCFPIPLSSAILGYCGFKHEFDDWYINLEDEGIEEGMPPLRYKNKNKTWYLKDFKIPAQPLYVHQLQNLYYALTRKELVIELGLYKNLPLFGPVDFFHPQQNKGLNHELL